MDWTVRGSNPCGGENFRTCSDRPWVPPSPLYKVYRVFPWSKATGTWRWPPITSSAAVLPLRAFVACSGVNFTLTFTFHRSSFLGVKRPGRDVHHKHQGLDPLIRSVSRVTAARAKASSVFHLFSFLVFCSGMISKGFSFVAFFASVKASSVCIHLSCLVCL